MRTTVVEYKTVVVEKQPTMTPPELNIPQRGS